MFVFISGKYLRMPLPCHMKKYISINNKFPDYFPQWWHILHPHQQLWSPCQSLVGSVFFTCHIKGCVMEALWGCFAFSWCLLVLNIFSYASTMLVHICYVVYSCLHGLSRVLFFYNSRYKCFFRSMDSNIFSKASNCLSSFLIVFPEKFLIFIKPKFFFSFILCELCLI